MPEMKSVFAAVYRPGKIGVKGDPIGVWICERPERILVQISGWKRNFELVCDRLEAKLDVTIPIDYRRAISFGDRTVFRIGPERLWIAGPLNDDVLLGLDVESLGAEAIVTEIGHSRSVLRIAGPKSELLLNRGLPIDLDPSVFPANSFAQSAIHHMPVLVHKVDTTHELAFDAYVSRELAVSFWEWLTEAAAPLGYEIKQPDKSS